MSATRQMIRTPTTHTVTGLLALATLVACADPLTAPPSPTVSRSVSSRERNVTIVDLGKRGGATAVAPNGVIAGYVYIYGVPHAALWKDGVLTDLGTGPSGSGAGATGISPRGQVVGWTWGAEGALVWNDGVPTALPSLGRSSTPHAINPSGVIAGVSTTNEYPRDHAAVWRDGKIVDLGTLGGNSWARAINSRGDVVGGSEAAPLWSPRHAVLWRGTTLIDLSTPASFQSDAWGINDRGQVVGWANWPPFEVLPTPHPVLWQNGVMVDLGSLGGTFGEARGIDARGRVVGYSITKDGAAHAFLWEDGVMTDLGTLGGRNSQALAITESGLIVGNAELSNGVANAVVWIVK